MKLFCVWCATLVLARSAHAQLAQEDGFYAPQTFRNHVGRAGLFYPAASGWSGQNSQQNRIESYQQGLFKPAAQPWSRGDVEPQQNRLAPEPWRPTVGAQEPWRPAVGAAEPWRVANSKEQKAAILHHKQALTADGNFRYEFASDNGVAAGEVIEPDGTRVGAFQYKDPSGQLVKLKYRAGKEGFQIIEGSHLPKSPEPVAYPQQGAAYQQAYTQQRQQFDLQQQHNLQPQQAPRPWTQATGPQQFQNYPAAAARPQGGQGGQGGQGAGNQYFQQSNWAAGRDEQEDDGQYRENDLDDQSQGQSLQQGPHNFGEGYSFEFQG